MSSLASASRGADYPDQAAAQRAADTRDPDGGDQSVAVADGVVADRQRGALALDRTAANL